MNNFKMISCASTVEKATYLSTFHKKSLLMNALRTRRLIYSQCYTTFVLFLSLSRYITKGSNHARGPRTPWKEFFSHLNTLKENSRVERDSPCTWYSLPETIGYPFQPVSTKININKVVEIVSSDAVHFTWKQFKSSVIEQTADANT